ncbi:hypothetical protein J6590_005621 [Homalodisca vitripennis]|nr:hypothetical protein J6590_005621 [Homalodisca vitripennis]
MVIGSPISPIFAKSLWKNLSNKLWFNSVQTENLVKDTWMTLLSSSILEMMKLNEFLSNINSISPSIHLAKEVSLHSPNKVQNKSLFPDVCVIRDMDVLQTTVYRPKHRGRGSYLCPNHHLAVSLFHMTHYDTTGNATINFLVSVPFLLFLVWLRS